MVELAHGLCRIGLLLRRLDAWALCQHLGDMVVKARADLHPTGGTLVKQVAHNRWDTILAWVSHERFKLHMEVHRPPSPTAAMWGDECARSLHMFACIGCVFRLFLVSMEPGAFRHSVFSSSGAFAAAP